MSEANLVRNGVAKPKVSSVFPGMRWHPQTGESRVFDKAEDVPEGWINTHPASLPAEAAPAGADETASLNMTRKEIVAALEEGGIQFNPRHGVKALYALLVENLKKALTEMDVPFNADTTDAKELLGLFPTE